MDAPAQKHVPRGRATLLVGLVVFALLLALPLLVPNYRLFQGATVMVTAIAILGLNIIVGYTGQLSIGHGAFYAIGAYSTAILLNEQLTPYWLSIIISGVLCFGLGFLFGFPILRLRGHYLALATFALGVTVPQLLQYQGFDRYTGGFQGIVLEKPPVPFGLPLNEDQWLYLFCLGVSGLMFLAGWNLVRGHVGRAMIAVRDHPTAATAMGINTGLLKTTSFAVSALYTGVAGGLSAIIVQFVSPDGFGLFLSVTLLVGVIVGGVASVSGAVFGSLFVTFIPNFADSISKALPWAIYGLMIIAVMYAAPSGIAGLIDRIIRRVRHIKTPARPPVENLEEAG